MASLFQELTELGDAYLALMYEDGKGVKKDLSKAKNYYRLACDGGNDEGYKKYKELNKRRVK